MRPPTVMKHNTQTWLGGNYRTWLERTSKPVGNHIELGWKEVIEAGWKPCRTRLEGISNPVGNKTVLTICASVTYQNLQVLQFCLQLCLFIVFSNITKMPARKT